MEITRAKPDANLIKSRFGSFYSGKLTVYELNNMKKQTEEREKSLNDNHDEFANYESSNLVK